MSNPGRDALVAMLSRLKSDLHALNLSKPEIARAQLQAKYPVTGDYLVEVRRLWQRGVEEGWLRDGASSALHGLRLAVPQKHFPFSIDAMILGSHAFGHGHPKGEISLSWAIDGSPRYCGMDPGWLVCSPGSKHVPDVKGGSVFVLTFLPDGKIDRDVKLKAPAATSLVQASRAAAAVNRAAASAPAATSRRAGARS